MTYKIGDRVRITGDRCIGNSLITKGMVGEIIEVKPNGSVCVEFDKNINGHDCLGMGRNGHCWWVGIKHLQLAPIETKRIVITSDGKETLARLYEGNKVIKKAVAKCSPEDEYNFEIGAGIAFDRLMGDKPVKPKYYNGKVVCVEAEKDTVYVVGKIYEFKDGRVKITPYASLPIETPITTLDEWNDDKNLYCKFIPLVE